VCIPLNSKFNCRGNFHRADKKKMLGAAHLNIDEPHTGMVCVMTGIAPDKQACQREGPGCTPSGALRAGGAHRKLASLPPSRKMTRQNTRTGINHHVTSASCLELQHMSSEAHGPRTAGLAPGPHPCASGSVSHACRHGGARLRDGSRRFQAQHDSRRQDTPQECRRKLAGEAASETAPQVSPQRSLLGRRGSGRGAARLHVLLVGLDGSGSLRALLLLVVGARFRRAGDLHRRRVGGCAVRLAAPRVGRRLGQLRRLLHHGRHLRRRLLVHLRGLLHGLHRLLRVHGLLRRHHLLLRPRRAS
jgi:hypothetical protein